MFGVCVYIYIYIYIYVYIKADKYSKNIIIIIIFEERESSLMWSNQVRPIVLNIFIKMSLNNII